MSLDKPLSWRAQIGPLLFLLGTTAILLTAVLNQDPRLLVTPSLALLICASLLLAASALLAKFFGQQRLLAYLITLLLATFSLTSLGLVFSQPLSCKASLLGQALGTPDLACRLAFAIGALILTAMTVCAFILARQKPTQPA